MAFNNSILQFLGLEEEVVSIGPAPSLSYYANESKLGSVETTITAVWTHQGKCRGSRCTSSPVLEPTVVTHSVACPGQGPGKNLWALMHIFNLLLLLRMQFMHGSIKSHICRGSRAACSAYATPHMLVHFVKLHQVSGLRSMTCSAAWSWSWSDMGCLPGVSYLRMPHFLPQGTVGQSR